MKMEFIFGELEKTGLTLLDEDSDLFWRVVLVRMHTDFKKHWFYLTLTRHKLLLT